MAGERPRRDPAPPATARVALAAVALLFLAAQVALVSSLPLGWDESIYASQTDPRRPALAFTAPRSRGMSWLVAPIQAVTSSTTALRVSLAVLASLALYGAYAVWLRVRPDASVPLAALAFASLWTTVFYGPTTMPNVAIALAGVFATGALLRTALGLAPRWLPWAGGGAVALATMVRPGDVVPLVGALGLAVLAHRPWRAQAVRLLAPPVTGAVVGALPWLVEAQVRYAGILPRVRRALATQSTGERFVPDYQLRALDGPLLCRPCNRATQPIPLSGVLLWAAGVALVALAMWLVLRRGGRRAGLVERAAALLPAGVGTALALPYLLLVGYAAPRFLLPAYALLVLPAGQAWRHLATRPGGRLRPAAAALTAVLFAGHLVVQYRILAATMDAQHESRGRWALVAERLAERGVSPPCLIVGPEAAPVAYLARCDAVHFSTRAGDERFTLADLERRMVGERVAIVLRPGQDRPGYTAGWQQVPATELPPRWRAFVAPSSE